MRNKSKEEIYRNMTAVRSKDSRIEKKLGSALWAAGIRYRKNYPINGKPDFALPGYKIAVFCDSNSWHGKNWAETRKADFKKNREFWIGKIERNMERDSEVNQALKGEGWTVVRFWEDEIKKKAEWCFNQVLKKLKMGATN